MAMKFCIFALISIAVVLSAGTGRSAEKYRLPILMYHHIIPAADMESHSRNGMVISEELFREQMEFLYDDGYYTITSDELYSFLYEDVALPPKSVMLTFDDGYISNFLYAYPILTQFQFKATLFIITGALEQTDKVYDKDKPDMLSRAQVEASTDVFDYASHTHDLHEEENGNTGFVTASLADAQADLQTSFYHVTNKKIFSYPHGQYNRSMIEMLRQNGVAMAVTISRGYATQDADPYTLNRIAIYPDCNLAAFQKILNGR